MLLSGDLKDWATHPRPSLLKVSQTLLPRHPSPPPPACCRVKPEPSKFMTAGTRWNPGGKQNCLDGSQETW